MIPVSKEEHEHLSNNHVLKICEVNEEDTECNRCYLNISASDTAYHCEICHFFLHKSCAELPEKIQHPFHSLHPLTLLDVLPYNEGWVLCNKCRNLFRGFRFSCQECDFNLDINCAALTHHSSDEHEDDDKSRPKVKVRHFSHQHELSLYNNLGYFEVDCSGCGKRIPDSDPGYSCMQCGFYLHESCSQMPEEIFEHVFHTNHILVGRPPDPHSRFPCNACQQIPNGITFGCSDCDFYLDVVCTCLTPTLKHKSHHHKLVYFTLQTDGKKQFLCKVCETDCQVPFYRCVECDLNLHFECIPLPNIFKYEDHIHPLIFTKRYVVDESGEDFCDICEKERNGDHFVYCCEECTIAAHIECVVGEENTAPGERKLDSTKALEGKEIEEKEKWEGDGAITNHPPEHEDKKTQKVKHFSHKHALSFYNMTAEDEVDCEGCCQPILGPARGCEPCEFILHESCFQMPPEMSHAFHPLHPLIGRAPNPDATFYCDSCQQIPRGISFGCSDCDFYLDAVCTSLTPTVKHPRHEHKLIYFTIETERISSMWCNVETKSFMCMVCKWDCDEVPFYRCVECNFNLHLKCCPLPKIVEHICHMHPLTLMDRVVEDPDSDECCCDVCESDRNIDHGVYYCEECKFAAHIDCVISQENSSLRHEEESEDGEIYQEDEEESEDEDQEDEEASDNDENNE